MTTTIGTHTAAQGSFDSASRAPNHVPPAHMPLRMPRNIVICSAPFAEPSRRPPTSSLMMPIFAGLKNAAWVANKKNAAKLSHSVRLA